MVKTGTGTLTLTGNNTYTGATTINAGTLVAASDTALPGQTALAVNLGATLRIGNGLANVQIGSLADGTSGGGSVVIGASDPSTLLTIAGNGSTTFSGALSGAGSIELDDAATLRLTGASNGGNIGTIGGDLDLCLCSTGRPHHRRRQAHRQRPVHGRGGGKRLPFRHQRRHADDRILACTRFG